MKKGLSQNHQKTNGLGHNQKEIREYVLLEWEGMHSGLQYYVHQLLCLQQTGRGCCGYGTSSRKIVPNEGTVRVFFTKIKEILNNAYLTYCIIIYSYLKILFME